MLLLGLGRWLVLLCVRSLRVVQVPFSQPLTHPYKRRDPERNRQPVPPHRTIDGLGPSHQPYEGRGSGDVPKPRPDETHQRSYDQQAQRFVPASSRRLTHHCPPTKGSFKTPPASLWIAWANHSAIVSASASRESAPTTYSGSGRLPRAGAASHHPPATVCHDRRPQW